uniref:C6 domain-containing protein n=1 Tax=Steinernema glaseri TaxID=37863 RepID=A0A1I7YM43_9BILA
MKCSQDSLAFGGAHISPLFSTGNKNVTLTCSAKKEEFAFFTFNNNNDRKLTTRTSAKTVLQCVDGKWKSAELDYPVTKVTCGEEVKCKACSLETLKAKTRGSLKHESTECFNATLTCTKNETLLLNGKLQTEPSVSFFCEGSDGWVTRIKETGVALQSAQCVPKNSDTLCNTENIRRNRTGPGTIKEYRSEWTLSCPPKENKFVHFSVNGMQVTNRSREEQFLDLHCSDNKWMFNNGEVTLNVTDVDCKYEGCRTNKIVFRICNI